MNALTRYLNRLFFARLTLLLFGIVSVVISFDLLERSDTVSLFCVCLTYFVAR